MNIIVEGLDRCGKDTQCNLLAEYFAKQNIQISLWHFEALKGYSNKEAYINASQELYKNAINILNQSQNPIICNRFIYGEYVYGPLYRHYTDDEANYPFEFDKQLNNNTALIVLVDSSFKCFTDREDGNSLAKDKTQCIIEYNKFIDVYNKSSLKNKFIIDIANKNIQEVFNLILEFTGLTRPKETESYNNLYIPNTKNSIEANLEFAKQPDNKLINPKKIVVCKFGKSPQLFSDKALTNESMMVGDWEVKKLLLVLCDIYPDAKIYYYGRCTWNDKQALDYFHKEVKWIKSSANKPVPDELLNVDQIHYIMGPHAQYNGTYKMNKLNGEERKTQAVMKNYVAPIIDLINKNPQAKQFPYMSDRRYAIVAADLLNKPDKIYCQCAYPIKYEAKTYTDLNSNYEKTEIELTPFRFDSIAVYKLNYQEFISNMSNFNEKANEVLIIGNQVANDKNAVKLSRYDRINYFIKDLKNPVIIGKWTCPEIVSDWKIKLPNSCYLNGLDHNELFEKIRHTRYSLVMFNVNDGPKHFIDNYSTPKYFESAFNGCLTFIECYEKKNHLFPEELQVRSSEELQKIIDRCNTDLSYLMSLYKKQISFIKNDYFTKNYFEKFIKGERIELCE